MIGLLTSSLNRLQATAQAAGDFSAWLSSRAPMPPYDMRARRP